MDKVLRHSHRVIEEVLTKNDVAIDMTMGAGNDTLVLARLAKKVYAFDIQEEALKKARETLKDFDNVEYILDSHDNVLNYVREKVKAVIFNLGYFPGGDKSITTKASTTLKALEKVLSILDKKGICAICLYPGHSEGKIESEKVLEYVKGLNQKEFEVLKYEFINQINEPPFLIAIEKR